MTKVRQNFKELYTKYAKRFTAPLVLEDIRACNHKPDMFTIGPRHVALAADSYGGDLGYAVLEQVPCCSCKRPYKEHTYDVVAFCILTRGCTSQEVQAQLAPLEKEFTADHIDGFAFIETPDKFRIKHVG